MSEPLDLTSPQYLRYEAEGTAKAREAREDAYRRRLPARRWRDIQVVASAAPRRPARPEAGSRLVSRRPAETQKRYDTFVRMESAFPSGPAADHGLLISPACQILEEEVHTLLVRPAESVTGPLASALAVTDPERAEMLRRWAARPNQATLGTASLILMALRRGMAQGRQDLADFLAAHFKPEFTAPLRANRLAVCLDAIRDRFRNPACHSLRLFAPADYEEFARLLVGRGRVAAWEADGPAPHPPAEDAALLHRLLTGSLLLPEVELPPAAAVERLTALARPADSGWRIDLVPWHADAASRLRDVSVEAARAGRPFRLGDPVCFAFRTERDCHVTLIDVGTTGTVTVLLPNRWQPEARVAGGRTHSLPGPPFPDFELRLTGRPGRERVIALATRTAPPPSLRPQEGDAFRILKEEEVAALAEELARLDPAARAACVCEFGIEPVRGPADQGS